MTCAYKAHVTICNNSLSLTTKSYIYKLASCSNQGGHAYDYHYQISDLDIYDMLIPSESGIYQVGMFNT